MSANTGDAAKPKAGEPEAKPKAGLEDVVAGESAICYLDGDDVF